MNISPLIASFFGSPYYAFWLLLLLIILIVIGYFLFIRMDDGLGGDSGSNEGSGAGKDAMGEKKADEKPKTAPAAAEAEPAALKGTQADEKFGLVFDSAPDNPDDLTKISGVGPVILQKLNEAGVYKFEQIASWDDNVIEEFGERLAFKDRIGREDWVAQAKKLAAEQDA